MSLIDNLQELAKAEQTAALRVYHEVLRRNNAPQSGDVATMRDAMACLGFGPERLEADLRVLNEAERLASEAAAPDLTNEVERAGQALTAHNAESERQARAAEVRRQELAGVLSDLQHKQTAGRQARGKLAQLRRQHSALFGDAPQVAEPEAGFKQTIGAWSDAEPSAERLAAQRPIGLEPAQNWN
jgi:hypothetical protein